MDKLINDFGFGLFIWASLIFIGLVLLLKKFAWKPILDAVNEREEGIKNALLSAENAKREMQNLKSDNEKLLAEARAERDSLMKEAREIKDKMINDAKSEAQAAIESEKNAAMAELKNQVSSLSLEIAEKLLQEELSNKETQTKLIEKMLGDAKLN
jgi:F-type H+-transporting ATPase subunit b